MGRKTRIVYLFQILKRGLLVKNKNFLFSNLARRMTSAQSILLACFVICKSGRRLCRSYFYQRRCWTLSRSANEGSKSRILDDISEVGTNAILMYDEQILTNPNSGNMKGVLLFADFGWGRYHFIFNSTKILGAERISPIIENFKAEWNKSDRLQSWYSLN